MDKADNPLRCFISSFRNRQLDPRLADQGLSRGMLVFAVPDLGILFRCRAEGEPIDLEFGAFFALLKFLSDKQSQLGIGKLKTIQVLSSNPEFVMAFTGNSRHLEEGSARMRLLKEHTRQMRIAVGLVEARKNQALVPAADYPSLPKDRGVEFGPSSEPEQKPAFKPFQRGVNL